MDIYVGLRQSIEDLEKALTERHRIKAEVSVTIEEEQHVLHWGKIQNSWHLYVKNSDGGKTKLVDAPLHVRVSMPAAIPDLLTAMAEAHKNTTERVKRATEEYNRFIEALLEDDACGP